MHVITRLLLNEIYPPFGIGFWLNFELHFVVHAVNVSWTKCEFELTSTVTLVLKMHILAKWAGHPKHYIFMLSLRLMHIKRF